MEKVIQERKKLVDELNSLNDRIKLEKETMFQFRLRYLEEEKTEVSTQLEILDSKIKMCNLGIANRQPIQLELVNSYKFGEHGSFIAYNDTGRYSDRKLKATGFIAGYKLKNVDTRPFKFKKAVYLDGSFDYTEDTIIKPNEEFIVTRADLASITLINGKYLTNGMIVSVKSLYDEKIAIKRNKPIKLRTPYITCTDGSVHSEPYVVYITETVKELGSKTKYILKDEYKEQFGFLEAHLQNKNKNENKKAACVLLSGLDTINVFGLLKPDIKSVAFIGNASGDSIKPNREVKDYIVLYEHKNTKIVYWVENDKAHICSTEPIDIKRLKLKRFKPYESLEMSGMKSVSEHRLISILQNCKNIDRFVYNGPIESVDDKPYSLISELKILLNNILYVVLNGEVIKDAEPAHGRKYCIDKVELRVLEEYTSNGKTIGYKLKNTGKNKLAYNKIVYSEYGLKYKKACVQTGEEFIATVHDLFSIAYICGALNSPNNLIANGKLEINTGEINTFKQYLGRGFLKIDTPKIEWNESIPTIELNELDEPNFELSEVVLNLNSINDKQNSNRY